MTLTYERAHRNLDRDRGEAKTHTCPCGEPAKDWAYQGASGVELYAPWGAPYSENQGDYLAMCKSCHKKLDGAGRAPGTLASLVRNRAALEERYRTDPEFRARRDANIRTRGPAAMREKFRSSPEILQQHVTMLLSARDRRRRCLECGRESNTSGMGSHLKHSGHTGYENID